MHSMMEQPEIGQADLPALIAAVKDNKHLTVQISVQKLIDIFKAVETESPFVQYGFEGQEVSLSDKFFDLNLQGESPNIVVFPEQDAEICFPRFVEAKAIQIGIDQYLDQKGFVSKLWRKESHLVNGLRALIQEDRALIELKDIIKLYLTEIDSETVQTEDLRLLEFILMQSGYLPMSKENPLFKMTDINQCRTILNCFLFFSKINMFIDVRILWETLRLMINAAESLLFSEEILEIVLKYVSTNLIFPRFALTEFSKEATLFTQIVTLTTQEVGHLSSASSEASAELMRSWDDEGVVNLAITPSEAAFKLFQNWSARSFFKQLPASDFNDKLQEENLKTLCHQLNKMSPDDMQNEVNLNALILNKDAIQRPVEFYNHRKGMLRNARNSQDPSITALQGLIALQEGIKLADILEVFVVSLQDKTSQGRAHLQVFSMIFDAISQEMFGKPLFNATRDTRNYGPLKSAIIALHLLMDSGHSQKIDKTALEFMVTFPYYEGDVDFKTAKQYIQPYLSRFFVLQKAGILNEILPADEGPRAEAHASTLLFGKIQVQKTRRKPSEDFVGLDGAFPR